MYRESQPRIYALYTLQGFISDEQHTEHSSKDSEESLLSAVAARSSRKGKNNVLLNCMQLRTLCFIHTYFVFLFATENYLALYLGIL